MSPAEQASTPSTAARTDISTEIRSLTMKYLLRALLALLILLGFLLALLHGRYQFTDAGVQPVPLCFDQRYFEGACPP